MENMMRMLAAIDYIEGHLTQPLSLRDIASEAFFSEFYFHKLFHLIVGDSPGEYIKKRRLYEAALALKKPEAKVIDVAYEFGYRSPEAFSRAFTKHFGFNPVDLKNNQNRVIRYPKPALTLTDLNHIRKGVSMEPRIEEKGEMKFVGPVYYGDNGNGEIPLFWSDHFGTVSSLETKKESGCYGICFHTDDYVRKGLFHYMPAVEVESFDIIPIEAVGKTIPEHKYAVFTHRDSVETLGDTYKFIYGTWFPNKRYRVNESFDFERYTTDQEGNDIIELYVPILDA